MAESFQLTKPWLVAVWPGMGHVAINAGYYLLAKLEMIFVAEFSPRELFEMEHVEVKAGLIQMGQLPRSRFFVWKDPLRVRDIVIFIGEAQPAVGKQAFCHKLIEFARTLGVERVFTFAAMATDMHPKRSPRVFGAATDQEGLDEIKRLEIEVIEDGHIGGLNGVLLGVAAEHSLRGTCLLGECPHMFAQWPFPRAALAVLRAFTSMVNIKVDFTELTEQAEAVEEKLGEIMSQIEAAIERQSQGEDEEEESFLPPPEPEARSLSEEDEKRIDALFNQVRDDRSKAYELKRELDRLHVFKEYEDRFLDLFKPPK
jgi:uncharacterized protein